jgi:hypothetical protein
LALHPGRNIDAKDVPARPYRLAQARKIGAGAASEVEHAVAPAQAHTRNRLGPKARRQKQQSIEQWNKSGDPIVKSADETSVAVHPLMDHDLAPLVRSITTRAVNLLPARRHT